MCGWIVSLCSGCVGCCTFCLICDAWSCKCWCIGTTLVTSCRCCVLVSCVHPVVILRAVCCTICSLSMFVSDALGDHMVGLQTTQPTSGGAVTVVSSCCANCVEPPPPPPAMGARFTVFLGMPAMRTRWMAGAAAHKSG